MFSSRPRSHRLHQMNLITAFSLWKRVKCFRFTLHQMNFITAFSLWKRVKCFPFTQHRMNLKTVFSLCKRVKCFPFSLRRRNLKTQQPSVISDSCLRKPCSWNWSHIIVMWSFSKSCLFPLLFVYTKSQIKPVFSNSFGLKSVFEKLRFRDELALTVGPTVEIKLCRVGRAQSIPTGAQVHWAIGSISILF